jgi:hypothetical protein
MRVFVLVGDERCRVVNFDAELFAQLANERIARLLAGLALTTRKLPPARHVLAGGPLRDEHAAGGIEKRTGHDVNQGDAQLSSFASAP